MPRLRLLAVAAAGATAAVLSVVGPPTPGAGREAEAQAARTVTVDPGPLTPGDPATVRWSGFTPNSAAYIYVCSRPGPGALPRSDDCYGDTLVTGLTGPDGTGSAQFKVRSVLYPYGVPRNDGTGLDFQPGGVFTTDCRGLIEGPGTRCAIAVTECSAVMDPNVSAVGPYDVTAGAVGSYDDDPLVDVTWAEGEDADGDGVPDVVASYLPKPVDPPDVLPEEPVASADGPRIFGHGSDLGGAVHVPWRRAIASDLKINLNIVATSHTLGIDSVIAGAADLAFSAAPASPAQLQAAAAAGQSLVYVPISVSTIAVGYNIYPLLPMRDVRVSATSLAGLLWPEGQADSTVASGSLGADQGSCRPPTSRLSVLYTKIGRSDAHLTVSSWLHEAWTKRTSDPPPWKFGVVDELPTQDLAQLQQRHADVPKFLADLKATGQTAFTFAARIGLMDTSWARDYPIQTAWIENEARQWVLPTAAGALKTLETSTIGADNVVDINELSDDPAAYPMVVVNYAVAPTTLTEDFTATDAQAVRQALTFMVSTAGQRIAEEEGFVPLPADLTFRAPGAIAQIGSIVPQSPEGTTTTTAPTTTAPPPTPAPTAAAGAPTAATPAGRAAAPPSGRGGTSPPSGTRPGTTIAGSTPPADTAGADDTSTTVPESGDAPVDESGMPEEPPADFFDSLLDAVPPAPDLPALGAAGATAAVAGQGINLWRTSRKRPPRPRP